MGYGIQHTAPLPVVGTTPRSTWAELLIDALDELRTTLDAKVTPAGMDINANLSFRSGATFYAATDINYVSFHTQTALLDDGVYPGVVYKGPDGELYYNDDAGNQVQLSSGGSVAAAAGNISGTGYGASGVEVAWVAADVAYEFRSGSGTDDFADGKFDDVYLNDGSGNFLRIAAPSMGADYSLTLPSAVPAANGALVQMATSGALTASNSVTLASNANITLTGTGTLKHGSRTYVISGADFVGGTGGVTDEAILLHDSSTNATYVAGVLLPAGARITSVVFTVVHGAGATNRAYGLKSRVLSTGIASTVVSTTDATDDDGPFTVSSGALTTTLAAGSVYYLVATLSEADDAVHGAEITYDTP